MAQQINLLTPILLAPKRYFSAAALLQALGLVVVGGLLIGGWLLLQARQTRQAFEATRAEADKERQLLIGAMTQLPGSADPTALNQQLNALQQGVAQRRLTLDELQKGQAVPGQSHSDVLRLLAATVPAPVWLSELRWSAGRMELEGRTLEPDALQPWVQRLAVHPLLKGQQLSAVKVERVADGAALGAPGNGLAAGSAVPAASRSATRERPVWRFTLVSESARPAAAQPSAARASAP
jgi:Tfp pilus assembly protein PilN